MEYICRKCGETVKTKSDYDVFEGMHWICFHFEFEHGEYDRDEPCDDVACPWNRISGRDKQILLSQISSKLESEDRLSGVYFELVEEETFRLPNKVYTINVLSTTHQCNELKQIWFETENLMEFVTQLKVISSTGKGAVRLESMSPNEFLLELKNIDSKGHVLVKYEIWKNKNVEYGSFETKIEDGFVINLSDIDAFVKALMSKWKN